MPINSSFLDIGSHFGDTITTMALHAKNNNRDDIRFYAFEPNSNKVLHIKNISKLNNLNITVFNCCVGKNSGKSSHDNNINPIFGSSSYRVDNNGVCDIICLNDICESINPVGIMHIDTEGWEADVIRGSSKLLNNKNNANLHIIAECWSNEVSIMRGFSNNPENDIINEIKKYNYKQLDDIHDEDRNLVFRIN